ncbi:MAG: LemA family protein [Candidatus Moranbacteria bacterium]|nr:LemA family protein [Candidatus Moranbacteria bacterium]
MLTLPLVLLVVAGGVLLYVVLAYNGLISLRNRTDEAWSDIDVQMKRRYDLIPNLVNAVKGYATHEQTVFEQVTQARAQAMSATGVANKGQAENMLTSALKSMFAIAEAYPDLKASQNFVELQRELSDTENKIQASRRFYNGNVRDLNTKIETFPSNLIASSFHFTQREFFELAEDEAAAKNPVEVKF